jgi:hypothetical protein
MKQFPVRLAVKILIFATLFSAAGCYLVFPVFNEMRYTITAILFYYSGEYEKILSQVRDKRAALARLEQKMAVSSDSGKTNTDYYSFIQKTLIKRDIQAIKVYSSKQTPGNDPGREDFSINFRGNYSILGKVINDLRVVLLIVP